jgi:hypothetical protein
MTEIGHHWSLATPAGPDVLDSGGDERHRRDGGHLRSIAIGIAAGILTYVAASQSPFASTPGRATGTSPPAAPSVCRVEVRAPAGERVACFATIEAATAGTGTGTGTTTWPTTRADRVRWAGWGGRT